MITNGDFSSALSGWSNEAGTAPSRVNAGNGAARGNYIMNLKTASITHRAIAFTGTKILLTGFVKFIATDAAGSFDITLYITANNAYVANPAASYVKLTINSEDAYVDATEYYLPFYLELESSAISYVHINMACDANVEVYIDDLRLHEVDKNVSLYEPNIMELKYEYHIDSHYELYDGTDKLYSRGWRPIYTIGYDYITAAGLVSNIGLSESLFNFFIPHSDNLAGSYVRMVDDFNASTFAKRYLGHSQTVDLRGIFLVKNKYREYGADYFSVVSA